MAITGMGRFGVVASVALFMSIVAAPALLAQSPSALYTWDASGNPSPNVENWAKNFGTNTVTLDNSTTPGALTITETGTAGEDIAITDGANRVRESSISSGGGTDLTGLDYLEFDLGHSGSAPIDVQFFVQASAGFNLVSLGPNLTVTPGVHTYQVPLSALTADQAVYVRTMGFNTRDHLAQGNVTWTLGEVRAGGTPLTSRNLITHDNGTVEGGLQGAIANFDLAAIQGNNGGQNQTGLSHNASGSGSLQWTDLGGSQGAAISWGNGTAWNGNTFNNRTTDLSNYQTVTIRISADDPNDGGGTVGFQLFFQKNNFAFQAADGGAAQNIVIDGGFQEFTFSLAGLTDMNVVDLTGLNLAAHAQNLIINVDNIQFNVPEPTTATALMLGGAVVLLRRRGRR
jgi:hypothetical protein